LFYYSLLYKYKIAKLIFVLANLSYLFAQLLELIVASSLSLQHSKLVV